MDKFFRKSLKILWHCIHFIIFTSVILMVSVGGVLQLLYWWRLFTRWVFGDIFVVNISDVNLRLMLRQYWMSSEGTWKAYHHCEWLGGVGLGLVCYWTTCSTLCFCTWRSWCPCASGCDAENAPYGQYCMSSEDTWKAFHFVVQLSITLNINLEQATGSRDLRWPAHSPRLS